MFLLIATAAHAQDDGVVLTHPNGLTVTAPGHLAATQTEHGFRMETRAAVRAPVAVLIELRDAPPPPVLTRLRIVNRVRVRYHITEQSGGSGGPEYRLEAARPIAGRHIYLVLTHQAEWPARPNFDLGWRMLTSATIAGRGR